MTGVLTRCWLLALATGWTSAEAQYRPEFFGGPTVGRIQSSAGNTSVAGLELGFGIGLGGQAILVGPEAFLLDGGSQRIRAFALAVRLRQRVGVFHPHLLASVGAYAWQRKTVVFLPELSVLGEADWNETDDLSGSMGFGLTVGGLAKPVSGIVEARWHRNLSQNEPAGSRTLLAMMAGIRLTW